MNLLIFLLVLLTTQQFINCFTFQMNLGEKRCFLQEIEGKENLRLSFQFHAQVQSYSSLQTDITVNKKNILSTTKHSYNIIENQDDDDINNKFAAVKKAKDIEVCFQYKNTEQRDNYSINVAFHMATFEDNVNPDDILEDASNLSHNTYVKYLIGMLKNSNMMMYQILYSIQLSLEQQQSANQLYWQMQDHISTMTYFKFAIALFIIIFQFWIITRFISKKQSQQPQNIV